MLSWLMVKQKTGAVSVQSLSLESHQLEHGSSEGQTGDLPAKMVEKAAWERYCADLHEKTVILISTGKEQTKFIAINGAVTTSMNSR